MNISQLKNSMIQQTKNINDPNEALYIQRQIAQIIGNLNSSNALLLAITNRSDIGK